MVSHSLELYVVGADIGSDVGTVLRSVWCVDNCMMVPVYLRASVNAGSRAGRQSQSLHE